MNSEKQCERGRSVVVNNGLTLNYKVNLNDSCLTLSFIICKMGTKMS